MINITVGWLRRISNPPKQISNTLIQISLLMLTVIIMTACTERKADVGINGSAIQLIDSVHDFGLCQGDSITKSCTFRLRNSGTEPLTINKIETSCGCTVADYSKEPLNPGDTTLIKVVYNGRSTVSGVFQKTLTIYSNASNGLARLSISGRTQKE